MILPAAKVAATNRRDDLNILDMGVVRENAIRRLMRELPISKEIAERCTDIVLEEEQHEMVRAGIVEIPDDDDAMMQPTEGNQH